MADFRIDYGLLYRLQDRVLQIVFSKPTEFYLSGGTCLHRFYYKERYSDDLDLFTHESSTFPFTVRELKNRLSDRFELHIKAETRDFVRWEILENRLKLQIDFINDRVRHFGEIKTVDDLPLDNPLNILTNKLTAVLSRDNPKDMFDIWTISRNLPVQWGSILKETQEKSHFQKSELIFRLESFPISLLDRLDLVNPFQTEQFRNDLMEIVRLIVDSDGV